MEHTPTPDPKLFEEYLATQLVEAAFQIVMLPLLRAYLRDPDLLRRYNYGRGQWNQPVTSADQQRIARAVTWLQDLAGKGFSIERLRELAKMIPLVGPYAALASYLDMLLVLS